MIAKIGSHRIFFTQNAIFSDDDFTLDSLLSYCNNKSTMMWCRRRNSSRRSTPMRVPAVWMFSRHPWAYIDTPVAWIETVYSPRKDANMVHHVD